MDLRDASALTDDIAANGQRQPIILFEGMILDGWHRHAACLAAGATPRMQDLPEGEDPVAFVLSSNLNRRHLTASQRAAAVVACREWRHVGRAVLNRVPGTHLTEPEMATEAGVSVKTIKDAKKAHRNGLGEAVRDGKVSAKAAAGRQTPKVEPKPPPEPDDRMDVIARDFEAMARVIEADDQLAAAWAEAQLAHEKYAQLDRLYSVKCRELDEMTKEAKRWKRKAEAK